MLEGSIKKAAFSMKEEEPKARCVGEKVPQVGCRGAYKTREMRVKFLAIQDSGKSTRRKIPYQSKQAHFYASAVLKRQVPREEHSQRRVNTNKTTRFIKLTKNDIFSGGSGQSTEKKEK